jgi:hypothetical protein
MYNKNDVNDNSNENDVALIISYHFKLIVKLIAYIILLL